MNTDLLHSLCKWFNERENSLGLAESCTGGLVSSQITSLAGVSSFYVGTIVSYSSEVKEELLDVPASLLHTLGAVSEPVAKAMANGARETLGCDWSIAITGISGPSGGTPEKPVGTVCFAVRGPGVELSTTQHFDGKDRLEIQKQSANFALELLWKGLHS